MLETVKNIIQNVVGKKNITEETNFLKDLGLNSFDITNIICAFEDHYNISIPTRDVWTIKQVSDVIDYLKSRGIK